MFMFDYFTVGRNSEKIAGRRGSYRREKSTQIFARRPRQFRVACARQVTKWTCVTGTAWQRIAENLHSGGVARPRPSTILLSCVLPIGPRDNGSKPRRMRTKRANGARDCCGRFPAATGISLTFWRNVGQEIITATSRSARFAPGGSGDGSLASCCVSRKAIQPSMSTRYS
jgi:hypothetical protein